MRLCVFVCSAFVVSLLGSLAAISRPSAKCKAHVRANRHRSISFMSFSNNGLSWEDNGTRIVQSALPGNRDSFTIGGVGSATTFHAKSGQVTEPFIVYPQSGEWLTDTLDTSRGGATHYYYGIVSSRRVRVTACPGEHSVRWYSIHGKDSLFIVRYGDGVLRRREDYDSVGYTRLVKEWYPSGVLKSVSRGASVASYSEEGILQESATDTMIEFHRVTCRRAYYLDGVLKSVTYYCGEEACLMWQYYDHSGILGATIAKTPLSALTATTEVVAAPPNPIYTFVTQMASFPGGDEAMRKSLELALPVALCASAAPLRGDYKVYVTIDRQDGAMIPDKVEGLNADRALQALSVAFKDVPHSRPAKVNGRRVDQSMVLNLVVK